MLETLDKMNDAELMQVRTRADELLRKHDAERKAKAVADAKAITEKAQADARALLASVGLSPKAVRPKHKRVRSGKHGGGDGAKAAKRAG